MESTIDFALGRVASLAGQTTLESTNGQPISHRLADALGWSGAPAHAESFSGHSGGLNLVRGYLGSQRATVFAANGSAASRLLLPDAALFAYHSSVHWGVIADQDAAIVFNSHWIKSGEWFHLREMRWTDIDQHEDLVKALTPAGIASGGLDKLAARVSSPDRVLEPVDDALVDRLDFWRREALRYGHDAENLDEDLHTLFAQLFVLRSVEDRGLAPDIPTLENATLGERVDSSRLQDLFSRAREQIQNELFASEPFRAFPDFVLSGIIRDLYTPSQLPQGAQRYNFAWIESDVLGRAYEKYLATVFFPSAPSPQLRLFEQPLRELESISVKKSGGVFYTPEYLVGTLIEQTISSAFASNPEEGYIPRIADFSCGSGSFLVGAVSVLLRELRKREPNRNWGRTLVDGQHIVGIDVDPRAVTLSRMNLWIRLTDEPKPLPLPSIENCIVLGDSLGEEVWGSLPCEYDVVVGNPPFIATGSVKSRSELARQFRTARGRFDYSYLFIERAIQRLAPHGLLGMVVPNRLFRNRDASLIRELIATETDLLKILDFGTVEVFERTSAYIGAIIARKLSASNDDRPAKTRAVLVSDVSDTRYLGGAILAAMTGTEVSESRSINGFDIDRPVGDRPWVVLSPGALRERVRLEQDATLLGEVAGIYQGIRTGANDIFIFTLGSSDGTVMSVTNGFGQQAILEGALLHPVVFGTDIQRYEVLDSNRVLLFPYRHGSVISEVELRDHYPLTFSYLERYRDLLANRSSIIASGLKWFELVRKRDERWLHSRKLLTRDLATRTSFALDDDGVVFIVGGTAVVPPVPELVLPLLAYLNSAVANEYLAEITPSFRGSFQKFEPQHLSRLPIPNFILEATDEAAVLGDLAMQRLLQRGSENGESLMNTEDEINELFQRNLDKALE